MRYIWLIPLLPGIGAAINGLVGIRSFSRRTAGVVACTTMVAALGLSLLAFWQLLGLPADARAYDVTVAEWIPTNSARRRATASALFQVPWGFRLDPLVGDDAARRHRHRHADSRLLDRLHGRRAAGRRTRGSSAT